jgi:CHAD domain-containing protein
MTEKWVEGGAAERVGEVAARALQGRLAAVLHYLPLAARKAEEDPEHVHQLRVWARRATAALRLYEGLLPHRRCAWLRKQLKRVRRAANDARDSDVLLRRLQKQTPSRARKRWREAVQAERAEAQEAVVAVHAQLGRGHRFARRVAGLLRRVRPRRGGKAAAAPARFGDWARKRLRAAAAEFFAAVPASRTDQAALHRFRIRGKKLRYAMELLAGAFPQEFRTWLYPTIEALQDRLGDINDLATATARLERQIEAAGPSSQATSWRRLLARERAQLAQACERFWEWCTPQMLQQVQGGFEAVLTQPARAGASREWEDVGEGPCRPAPDVPAQGRPTARGREATHGADRGGTGRVGTAAGPGTCPDGRR